MLFGVGQGMGVLDGVDIVRGKGQFLAIILLTYLLTSFFTIAYFTTGISRLPAFMAVDSVYQT